MIKIKLIDVRFCSRIGVFEQERIVGNEFILNLDVNIDSARFIEEDLETSISYAEIYEIVKGIMDKDWLLLETVGMKIKHAMNERWPYIKGGRISIVKVSPPIKGINGKCGIEILF